MRAFALLLIVVNFAYWGWTHWINAPEPELLVGSNFNGLDVQRIILARERDRLHLSNNAIPAPSAGTPADTHVLTDNVHTPLAANGHAQSCITVGPFQDLSSASQASATLKTAGHQPRQRLEQGELWLGYWVSIPNFTNREDAERALARLQQNGIDDVYISLSPESNNLVSLGVFKEAERAQRRMQDAKALGFSAQISERTRPGSVYWLDVDLAMPGTNLDVAVLGAQPGKILRLEQHPCVSEAGAKLAR